MINAAQKNKIIEEFKANTTAIFDENRQKWDLEASMEKGDVDETRTIVTSIRDIMIAKIPYGMQIPKATMYLTTSGAGEAISFINIKLTNKINSPKSFGYPITITKSKALDKVFEYMQSVYTALVLDEMIEVNLAKVNDVLQQAATDAGLEYSIQITAPIGNEGKKIASITDDEVVFVADEDRVFNLDNVIVLLDGPTDLISEEVIQDHYESIVAELSKATTPEQLVGIHGGVLVSYVADISKRLKPSTLIKKVCNRNIANYRGDKDVIMYYMNDGVYALIARRSGEYEVILSPFSLDTLLRVDCDVLQSVK